jgi:L-histidine N-alpha-methyltransferase
MTPPTTTTTNPSAKSGTSADESPAQVPDFDGTARDDGISVSHDATIDIWLDPDDLARAMRDDVAAGFVSTPKSTSPKWFYDEVGSALFDTITRLDEYYPTRAEREILGDHAAEIIATAGADTFVELGSGTSDKTKLLLDAGRDAGTLLRFIPFDVSAEFLAAAADQLSERYPGLAVHGVVGDFDRHLGHIPTGGRRLVILLGGTIGNYPPAERKEFLAAITSTMEPGDHLLLGTDLVKDPARLELAYDDPVGVTAAFNRNVLAVLNRELDADFDLRTFDHVARWNAEDEWIEMHLRSTVDQTVRVGELDLAVDLAAGEMIHTEVSAKFTPERVAAELGEAGLEIVGWWTDRADDFGVSLSVLR